MLLGVDVGGTFTDAVLLRDGGVFTAKAPTTPRDETRGVLAATNAVLTQAGVRPANVERFAHGMTVATNALLEGRTARSALIATEGFTDVVELGRQARASLYRLCAAHPPALAPPHLRFAAQERMGPDGPIRELEGLADLVERVGAAEVDAVAVVLLHSYAHPDHERRIGAALREALPNVHVSLSHEIVGTFREFERAATTEVDAALSPLLARYLERLREACLAAGLVVPAVMQSSGGLIDIDRAAGNAAVTVLSGPAGGAHAAALVARASNLQDVLCFDMGGTSCDVSVTEAGEVRESAERVIAGRPLALPMLDIHTVGAGGGSIAWRDGGGALRVGPQSAGALPGPACYARGGVEPTVTDANVVLGYLPHDVRLAAEVDLDAARAREAVARLADQLGLSVVSCAAGIVEVANAEMVAALRVMTVERGVDPRGFVLMAFGGAGPLHAAALAAEMGINRVVCPTAGGVLSALGLAGAPARRDASSSYGGASVAELRARVRAELGAAPVRERVVYELRYAGQSFELGVEAPHDAGRPLLEAGFHRAHEQRYGYADERAAVELVTVRVSAWGPPATVELSGGAAGAPREAPRRATFDGVECETTLVLGQPVAGACVSGPAICVLPSTTLLIPPAWSAQASDVGTIVMEAST